RDTPKYSAISSSSRFSTSCFSAWRAIGLKSPSHSKALISRIARDTFVGVACSSSIGVPSSCLCSSHNSGGSTPSLFSQSKNSLGLALNHLEIFFPRPNMKAIFLSIPSLPPKFTHNVIHHRVFYNLDAHSSMVVSLESLRRLVMTSETRKR